MNFPGTGGRGENGVHGCGALRGATRFRGPIGWACRGVSAPVFRARCFCPIAKNSTAAMAPSFRGPARRVRSAAPGRFSPGPGLGRAPSPDRLLPVGLVTPPHQCLAVFLSNSRLFSPPVIIAAGNYHRRFQRFLFVFRRKMARRQDFYFIAAWSYDRKLCSDER